MSDIIVDILGLNHVDMLYVYIALGAILVLFGIRYTAQILKERVKNWRGYVYYAIENICIMLGFVCTIAVTLCIINGVIDRFDKMAISERISLYGSAKFGDTMLFKVVGMIAVPVAVLIVLFIAFCIIKPMIDALKELANTEKE